MGKLEAAGRAYDGITIPEELGERVNEAIKKSRMIHDQEQKKRRKGKTVRVVFATAAAAAVFFVTGLNTSSAFAAAAGELPVIGALARVLTFRSYESVDADKAVYEEIPGVSIEKATVDENKFTDEVNVKIQETCDAYVEGATARVTEYKEAFLAAGGTEEEFAAKNITIEVDYRIKSQTDRVLSFVVEGTESRETADDMTEYYNLDLKSLQYLTLRDVLGADYKEIADASIRKQMRSREAADDSVVFWTETEGGFSGIDENVKFYVNEQGLPVIVFEKYEIAPGAMGMIEFVIDPKETSFTGKEL